MVSRVKEFSPALMRTAGSLPRITRCLESLVSSQAPGQPHLSKPVVNMQRIKEEDGEEEVGVQRCHSLPTSRPQADDSPR